MGAALALVLVVVAGATETAALHFERGNALALEGRYAAASDAYAEAIRLEPTHLRARLGQATALVLDGRCREARDRLREGLDALPRSLDLIHATARVLLTCADPEVRDTQVALELARTVHARLGDFESGETVGMAHAASGAFEEAARWQADLIAEAERRGDRAWAERLHPNLERYRRGELPAPAR
jgi:tetratricopeptide (TPR) repeat protein